MKKKLFLCIFCAFVITGCASAPGTSIHKVIERDGIDALLIPAEYREVYFSPQNSLDRHCRAPDPDFTVQASDSVSLGLSALGAGKQGDVGMGSGQAALGLGGRSADVLITRELMYRACEMSSNINADAQATIAIYERFLQAVENIANVQTEVGTGSASDSSTSAAPSKHTDNSTSTNSNSNSNSSWGN